MLKILAGLVVLVALFGCGGGDPADIDADMERQRIGPSEVMPQARERINPPDCVAHPEQCR
jgi:hypothetical protein